LGEAGERQLYDVGMAAPRRRELRPEGDHYEDRQALRLAYQSQHEQPHEGVLRRGNNIRMRLGGYPSPLSPFPEKPKGIHWRTLERLSHRVWRTEGAAELHLAMPLGRLKARVGRRKRAKGLWT
jgi:hypothetical protein